MTMPSAETALLRILSDSSCQRINDGTIDNPDLDGRVSSNPGRALGSQFLYYRKLGQSLHEQVSTPSAALHIVKPPSI